MRNDRRKDRRMKSNDENPFSLKNTLYIAGTILALGIIAFIITVMVYNNSIDKLYADLESQEIAKVQEETSNVLEEASANLGKTVNEVANGAKETPTKNEEVKETTVKQNVESQENKKVEETKVSETKASETKSSETKKEESKKVKNEKEEKKSPVFSMPVDGEIQKEYSVDKLVYSETLKEWITHTGIDIKADKTTVVKAAEEGTVSAIKNDPRYGITVIVEHSDGFETRYANLLTAEFVTVGEKVTKGQTVGTVGDTGAFELLDEPHLHFELLKNGEYQDPTSIIK